MKPLMQIGFMPEALSVKPQPYKHDWQPGVPYNRIYTGWAHPPKDYDKWRELVYQWVKHSVEKYGRAEVESWWWEVWNEPDIGYWQGTPEEYMKLYDYAADGLKRALPTARIGGPHVTGPLGERTQKFLRDFIEHCLRGTNYATGKVGSPLDYIGFHAKGAPRVMKEADPPYVRMGVSNQLRAIANGFAIVASYPELKNTPIVIGESDPEGCAACPVKTDPHNALSQRHDVLELHRRADRADLRAGRSPRRQPDGLGDVGVRVRGSAVLLRLPRSRDQRHRQAGAERLPHARPDGWRSRRASRAAADSRSPPCATPASASRPTSTRWRRARRARSRSCSGTTTTTTSRRRMRRSS